MLKNLTECSCPSSYSGKREINLLRNLGHTRKLHPFSFRPTQAEVKIWSHIGYCRLGSFPCPTQHPGNTGCLHLSCTTRRAWCYLREEWSDPRCVTDTRTSKPLYPQQHHQSPRALLSSSQQPCLLPPLNQLWPYQSASFLSSLQSHSDLTDIEKTSKQTKFLPHTSTTGLTFQSKYNANLVSRRLAMVELANDHNDCVRKEEALAQRRWDTMYAGVILVSEVRNRPFHHVISSRSPAPTSGCSLKSCFIISPIPLDRNILLFFFSDFEPFDI